MEAVHNLCFQSPNYYSNTIPLGVTKTGDKLHGRGTWKSFTDNLQRTILFTDNTDILDRIKSADSISRNIFEVSLSIKSIGLSLVDNKAKREVAYIGITQYTIIDSLIF